MRNRLITRGFTVVELLIVVVVIGILATVILAAYSNLSQRAINSSLRTDISNAKKQVENFYGLNGVYPIANNCTNTAATEVCLQPSGNNSLSYTPNNGTNPTSYTLYASNGSLLMDKNLSLIVPVTFDTASQAPNGTNSTTWSHTIGANAKILILFGWEFGYDFPAFKINGQSLFTKLYTGGSSYTVSIYYLLNPPTGTVTLSATGNSFNISAASVSYNNVSGIGSVSIGNATPTVTTASTPSSVGAMAVGWFSPLQSQTYTATSGGTSRVNGVGSGSMVVMDAAGANNVTFTATRGGNVTHSPLAFSLQP